MKNEKEYQKQYRIKNRAILKKKRHEYYIKNKDKITCASKEWRVNNLKKRHDYDMLYRKKNKKKIKEKTRKWYYENRELIIKRVAKCKKEQYKKYPWVRTYDNIIRRTKYKKEYRRYGISNHLSIEDVKFLFFRDKADKMEWPSIDRIDGYGDYTIQNCRFMEYYDNLRRPRAWRRKEVSMKNLGNTGRTHFKKGHRPWCAGKKRPEISGANHWTKKKHQIGKDKNG